jgi:hypothetical protein
VLVLGGGRGRGAGGTGNRGDRDGDDGFLDHCEPFAFLGKFALTAMRAEGIYRGGLRWPITGALIRKSGRKECVVRRLMLLMGKIRDVACA